MGILPYMVNGRLPALGDSQNPRDSLQPSIGAGYIQKRSADNTAPKISRTTPGEARRCRQPTQSDRGDEGHTADESTCPPVILPARRRDPGFPVKRALCKIFHCGHEMSAPAEIGTITDYPARNRPDITPSLEPAEQGNDAPPQPSQADGKEPIKEKRHGQALRLHWIETADTMV